MKNISSIAAVCLYLIAAVLYMYSMFAEDKTLFLCFGAVAMCLGAVLTLRSSNKK